MANKRQRKKLGTARGIGQKTVDEYKRLAKNTNAKLNRLKKNHGLDLKRTTTKESDFYVPDITEFKSKKEFNQWAKKVQNFTNRNNLNYQYESNDFNVVASKARLNEMRRNNKEQIKRANELKAEIENRPHYFRGEYQGTVGQEMKKVKDPDMSFVRTPEKFDFSKVMSYDRLRDLEQRYEERKSGQYYLKRMGQMQDNFIDMIQRAFNSDADDLANKLASMPADDFYELYTIFKDMQFRQFYNAKNELVGKDPQLKRIESYVKRYEDGDINMDLKNFPSSGGFTRK